MPIYPAFTELAIKEIPSFQCDSVKTECSWLVTLKVLPPTVQQLYYNALNITKCKTMSQELDI